jgi:ATP-binding cassette subfamily F protein 3
MDPDLLLLDEPTNHLDLESLLWLEEFLRSFRGALLLVSHDTEFLNRMVGEVLEIEQRKLYSYRGNLESYAAQKEERINQLRAQYEGQQARIAEIEAFVRRFGAKATKARQAQSRMKELDRMERIEMPDDRQTVRFRFPPAPHSGREVVTLKHAAVAFGEKTVFRDMDLVIQRGSRMAIVGVNGAGKTTLLKLLAGQLDPSSGVAKPGHLVQVGYYAQHQAEALDLNKTIQAELEAVAPELPISRIRGIAGAFLFSGDAVEKKCRVLSGGEKARVALAKLLLAPSNFLLLDEPTNHLDIESRGVLLEALQDYKGTLCLVSHDRAFISPLVDSVLEIVPEPGGSKVHALLGGYEDYLARKTREVSEAARRLKGDERELKTATGSEPSAKRERTGPSNNQRRAWEKERDQLEAEITKLEREQALVQTELADVATYDDKEKSLAAAEKSRGLSSLLGEKLARWEELSNLLGS